MSPQSHPTLPVAQSRWAVILVRLPERDPEALFEVLPRTRRVIDEDLPLVTRVTRDLGKARRTANRLRRTGAQVVVVEEPAERDWTAFCLNHPAQLAAQRCIRCNKPICPGCMVEAKGRRYCAECLVIRLRQTRSTRRRQLLMALIFAIFIYQVVDFLQEDQQRVGGLGYITVGVFQFAPPGLAAAPLIRTLNQPRTGARVSTSLRDLSTWFDLEHHRYTGITAPYLDVSVRGPWEIDVEPPALAKPNDAWWRTMLRAWKYPRYFHDLARNSGVNLEEYAVRVYVIYGEEGGDFAAHSRGSEKGRIAIAFTSLAERNAAYSLVTVAHELAHALGARDTYDSRTSMAKHPEGFVEPYRDPLYPQRYAELMAVDIPIFPDEEREITSLNQVRIGHQTAADINWIGPEQAHLFYTPPATSPAERLTDPEQVEVQDAPITDQPSGNGMPPR